MKPVFDRAEVRPAVSGPCPSLPPSLHPWFISGTALATFETLNTLSLSRVCAPLSRSFFPGFVGRKILAESSSVEEEEEEAAAGT